METWSETDTAVVKGKGQILGHINSVRNDVSEFGQHNVKILFNDIAQALGYQNKWETNWKLQVSAQSFQDGDIICLLQGASKPSVVRLCKDHFTMITPAGTPQPKRYGENSNDISRKKSSMGGYCDIFLTWKIPLTRKNKVGLEDTADFVDMALAPNHQEEYSEAMKRLNYITLVVANIAMKELEVKSISKAIEHLLYQWYKRSICSRFGPHCCEKFSIL